MDFVLINVVTKSRFEKWVCTPTWMHLFLLAPMI